MVGFVDWAIRENIKDLAEEDKRFEAVKSLKIFGIRAIPFLVEALGDPTRNAYASIVLSDIGEPAIPALLDVLGDEPKAAYASVIFVDMRKKNIKTQAIIVPGLIAALADKRKRAFAYTTLRELGPPALEPYIPALITGLGNTEGGEFSAQLLLGVGKPAVGPLLSVASDESKRGWPEKILQEIAENDKTVQLPAATMKKVQAQEPPSPPGLPRAHYCTNCGSKVETSDKFCRSCGTRVG